MSTEGAAWPSFAGAGTPSSSSSSPSSSFASPNSFPQAHHALPLAAVPAQLPQLPPPVPQLRPAADGHIGGDGDHHHEGGNAEQPGHEELDLPLGYRFSPTEVELVLDYLVNKVLQRPLPADVIVDIFDMYKFDPHQLPRGSRYSMKGESYFFTTRTRRYPNGSRPSRSTPAGFWKATGKDFDVEATTDDGVVIVGYRKTLVFYFGNAQRNSKTNWMMQEFRINEKLEQYKNHDRPEMNSYVLCKVYNRDARPGP